MRVPWKTLMLLFFTLFMALGMSFKWQKSGNRPGYVSVGHLLSQMFFQSSLFIYVYVWFSATAKKKYSQRKQIFSQSLEAKSMQCIRLWLWSPSTGWRMSLKQNWYTDWTRGQISLNPAGCSSCCWHWRSGRFVAGGGGTGCKEPEEAVQSPWQLEEALRKGRSPKGTSKTDTNKTIKDAGYYILSYIYILIYSIILR